MDEQVIQVMARAITFANLTDPHPEPGVTVLQAAIPQVDTRRFAVAALKALDEAGYDIIKRKANA